MALYTELLSEYLLNGNTLPTSFSQISGFENAFKARYLNREIGFETETLFDTKLTGKADIIIPLYSARLTAYNAALTALTSNPTKQTTKRNTGTQTNERDIAEGGTEEHERDISDGGADYVSAINSATQGATSGSRTELPFNTSTATASETTHTDAFTNSTNSNQTNTYGKTTSDDLDITFGKTTSDDNTRTDNLSEVISVTGFSFEDNLEKIEFLQNKIHNIIEMCLNEFEDCFMQVF